MAKSMTGTVRRNDLEGGFWELVTDGGDRYQLRGGDDGLRVEGQRVAIEGKVARDAMGFAMASPILDVVSWSKR
jgi:hypothetical protein